MAKVREAVGEIACPFCKRDAELHAFEERQKLDPDSEGGGKPTYPKKHFIICPPVKGYRGCGTILANGNGAQEKMMDLGKIFGPAGRQSKPAAAAEPPPPPAPAAPSSAPPPPKAAEKHNPFKLW
jgi:hypothetical protein